MSIVKGLKKLFIKRVSGGFRNKRSPELKPPHAYQNILIITDADNSEILAEAQAIFKSARITLLSRRQKKEDAATFGNYTYHTSDLNLTGKVKSEQLIELFNKEFDLILDLSTYNELNLVVLERIKHSFAIGQYAEQKNSLYDLILTADQTSAEFFNVAATQLTTLSTNE